MSASPTNNIECAEFIGTESWIYRNNYYCLYLIYKYIWCLPRVLQRHGLNNSGNLGNIFSKNTANQYNAKTNNKMNSFFYYSHFNSLLSCENSHLCKSTTVNGLSVQCGSKHCWICQVPAILVYGKFSSIFTEKYLHSIKYC